MSPPCASWRGALTTKKIKRAVGRGNAASLRAQKRKPKRASVYAVHKRFEESRRTWGGVRSVAARVGSPAPDAVAPGVRMPVRVPCPCTARYPSRKRVEVDQTVCSAAKTIVSRARPPRLGNAGCVARHEPVGGVKRSRLNADPETSRVRARETTHARRYGINQVTRMSSLSCNAVGERRNRMPAVNVCLPKIAHRLAGGGALLEPELQPVQQRAMLRLASMVRGGC